MVLQTEGRLKSSSNTAINTSWQQNELLAIWQRALKMLMILSDMNAIEDNGLNGRRKYE